MPTSPTVKGVVFAIVRFKEADLHTLGERKDHLPSEVKLPPLTRRLLVPSTYGPDGKALGDIGRARVDRRDPSAGGSARAIPTSPRLE